MGKKELGADIKRTIEEHLPAQVGSVLKERIEQADAMEDKIKSLEERIELKDKIITKAGDLDRREEEAKILMDRAQALKTEADNMKREMRVKELENNVQHEREKANFAMEICRLLVRNTTYREKVLVSEAAGVVPITELHGCQQGGYPVSVPIDRNTEHSAE